MNIEQQVIAKIKTRVVNQSRYTYPSAEVDDKTNDTMYVVADDMTDLQTYGFLADKSIISDEKLLALVEKMSVEDLYHDSHWIDGVADYIIQNKEDCRQLWTHLRLGINNAESL